MSFQVPSMLYRSCSSSSGNPAKEKEIYGEVQSRFDGYVTSTATTDEVEGEDYDGAVAIGGRQTFTAPAAILNDVAGEDLLKHLLNIGDQLLLIEKMNTEQCNICDCEAYRWEREIDERNLSIGDDELDGVFPEGYKVLPPPAGYIPLRTPARKLTATPTPLAGANSGFYMQQEDKTASKYMDTLTKGGNLPFLKPEDPQYFDKLLIDVDKDSLSPEELKE
ncbi:hypothetical protein OUZ56_033944 [Daphnia magna]|uniref:Splicing factor 3B subunit 1 domain-containing protein n=1 Tax=Daphnia magna TaxID=35525 RepID=A0ABR0BBB5_9CRUS|nr:hypothetical protein OUZ56_033944 [Daphnia magna]